MEEGRGKEEGLHFSRGGGSVLTLAAAATEQQQGSRSRQLEQQEQQKQGEQGEQGAACSWRCALWKGNGHSSGGKEPWGEDEWAPRDEASSFSLTLCFHRRTKLPSDARVYSCIIIIMIMIIIRSVVVVIAAVVVSTVCTLLCRGALRRSLVSYRGLQDHIPTSTATGGGRRMLKAAAAAAASYLTRLCVWA